MKYDTELIKTIALFEKITRAKVKDCFYAKEKLVFVVQPGEMGKALGKNKINLKKLSRLIRDKIKIVEFDPDKLKFIVNFLNPLQIQNIQEEGDTIIIMGVDDKTNGLIIGSRAQNLRFLEEVVNKYFKVEEIKVIQHY